MAICGNLEEEAGSSSWGDSVNSGSLDTEATPGWPWILVSLRKHRGWAARKLAQELRDQALRIGIKLPEDLESIKRTIRNWEHGRTKPDPDYSAALILVYATTLELFRCTITPGSELHRLDIAFNEMGVEVKRRHLLFSTLAATLAATGGLSLDSLRLGTQERLKWVLRHPSSLDTETIDGLDLTIGDLRRRYETGPSIRLLGELSRQCDDVEALLGGAQPDAVRQALCLVAGKTFDLALWASWDLRDLVGVEEYFAKAGHATKELRDSWIGACVKVSKSFIPMYELGDLDSALDLLDAARDLASRGSSNAISSWQGCVEGEVHALNGDRRNCLRALNRATEQVGGINADDPGASLFNEVRLAGFKGICLMDLGDYETADAEFSEALRQAGPEMSRQGAIIETDRAKLRILQGHPEEGARMLGKVLTTARSVKGYTIDRVFLARRQLHPWRAERFVISLDEQIFALGYRVPRL